MFFKKENEQKENIEKIIFFELVLDLYKEDNA